MIHTFWQSQDSALLVNVQCVCGGGVRILAKATQPRTQDTIPVQYRWCSINISRLHYGHVIFFWQVLYTLHTRETRVAVLQQSIYSACTAYFDSLGVYWMNILTLWVKAYGCYKCFLGILLYCFGCFFSFLIVVGAAKSTISSSTTITTTTSSSSSSIN